MTTGRLTATLVGILLLCAVAGGVGAFVIGRQDAKAVAATDGTTSPGSSGSEPGSSTARSSRSGSPSSTALQSEPSSSGSSTGDSDVSSLPSTTSTTSRTAATPSDPGRTAVMLAGVAADDPQAAEIRDLLQRHFDAINNRDYELWAGTVTKEQSAAVPEQRWLKEYSTTSDSEISVIVIDSDPRQVQLTFRSRQAPELAPDRKSDCVTWSVVFPLVTANGGLRIGPSAEHRARYRPCHGP